MKENIKIIKIEGNIVYLQFSNKKIRKYLKDNFLNEPIIGQEVEILKNGLIINSTKKTNYKKKNKILQILPAIIVLLIFLVLYYTILNKDGNNINIQIDTIIYVYSITILILAILYTFFIHNEILGTILATLIVIPLTILTIYLIIRFFIILWGFVACLSCLGGLNGNNN